MTEKLWSFRIAQAGADAPSVEREVLRKRFTNSIIILLPLSNSRFAILGADRQLHCIVNDAPSAEEWTRIAEELETKLRERQRIVRAESAFYGEPSDKALARDLKRGRSEPLVPAGELEW